MQQVRKFAFDVSWVLVSSAVNLVLGFALRIILARWLGSFDLGLYTLVLTVQEFATLVAGLGMSSALVKYVAEYRYDKDKLSQIIFSAFTVTVIFAVVAALLLYFLSSIIAGFFNMPQLAHLLKILAFSLPFIIVNQSSLGLENGLRRMKYYAAQLIMRSFLMIVLIVTLVWMGYGVEGTVWGLVLSIVGTSIWGLYLAREFYHVAARDFLKNSKKLLRFGVQAFGANAVSLVANQADTLIVGYYLAADKVGYFGIAVNLSMFFSILPNAIQRITFPATSRYWAQNSRQALQMMLDKSMKYCACVLFPAGLVLGFFAKEIITLLYGSDFIQSTSPLLVLVVARVLTGATFGPIGASFSGRGRPDIGLKVDTFSAAINIVLNIMLIPRFGIVGAAVATGISLLIEASVCLALLPRMLGVKIDIRWYGITIGTTAAAVIIFWIGSKLLSPYIVGGVVIISYIIIVLRFFLTKDDKALFKSFASSLIKRQASQG
jgi:stage V sporulation protein B